MKANWWILSLFGLAVVVLSVSGCEEQATAAEKAASPEVAAPAEAVTAAEAENVVETVPEVDQAQPKIVFDHVEHDFGDISPKSKNKCEFKFTNKGDGILKVKKKIGSTCGCTVPSLSKEEYLPSESGTIKVTYSAGSRAGRASKHLYVYSNDKKDLKVRLTIKGKIIEKISVEPARLSLALNKENAGCPEITIESKDGKEFSITRLTASGQTMTAEYDPSVKTTKLILTPKVDAEKIKNQLNGILTIYLTHPDMDKVVIPYTVLAPFKTDPATIIALNAKPGQTIQRTVYVLSNYNEPFEVESVEAADDFVKVADVEELDNNRYKIDFEITPPAQSEKRHFNSTVTIDIAGGQTLKINVIGALQQQKK